MNYEMIVGLETHLELSTDSKLFCGCSTAFGAPPNTHCCPVCTGMPGALPVLNRQALYLAIKAGLATGCTIHTETYADRKQYHYPDLPRAFQITQFSHPLCTDGQLTLSNGNVIRIERIHIEDDAGKLIREADGVKADYNRCGVPLIEIVTAPDFRSVGEITEYLERLQRVMQYVGVSDGKMQEGSMRCDVNISVRPAGSTTLGTRTEIKNMNSFRFIEQAVTFETARQIACLQRGETVVQETRRYNEHTKQTESMRGKEDATDYRYFREPDLGCIHLSQEEIAACREQFPELPDLRFARYREWGLSEKEANDIVKYRAVADYFERASAGVSPVTTARLLTGAVFSRVADESAKQRGEMPISAVHLHRLVQLIDRGELRQNVAKRILEKMMDTGRSPDDLITDADRKTVDADALAALCRQVIADNPRAVADVRGGKTIAVRALIGGVMKASRGTADAEAAHRCLLQLLETEKSENE